MGWASTSRCWFFFVCACSKKPTRPKPSKPCESRVQAETLARNHGSPDPRVDADTKDSGGNLPPLNQGQDLGLVQTSTGASVLKVGRRQGFRLLVVRVKVSGFVLVSGFKVSGCEIARLIEFQALE